MSWEQARRDAEKWIQKMGLPKSVQGEHINLEDYSSSLPADLKEGYRVMVLGAAKRILEKRGASVRITPAGQ